MAEVWLAMDESLTRPVAIKILRPQLARDEVAIERFRREARIVAGLTHPNIVAVYDAVDFDGQQAVVMQYVPGRSLREMLDAERKLTIDQTLRIGTAVASALDAAHAAGLVHRDVKPGNILITPDGRVLLTDFGIAKDTTGSPGDDLTSDNVMMGTAKYLSPEQVRGRRLDGRADLYSLGLVLYECLAGRVPFQGESDADTALARLQRDPTPLGRMRPTLPAGLTALVHRLLAKEPDARPTSGAQVSEAIERIRLTAEEPQRQIEPLAPPTPRLFDDAPATEPARPRPASTPNSATARPAVSRPITPPNGIVVRGHPNRQLDQKRGSSLMIIGGLLIAAMIAGVFLWTALRGEDPAGTPSRTTVASEDSEATVATDAPAAPSGELRVASLATFDPRGDGEENDGRIDLAEDGDPGTAWLTECYQNQYFGAKQGVGIVVELTGPARGRLDLTMASAPWNVDVYAATSAFGTIEEWGRPIAQDADQQSLAASFELDSDDRYLLLMLREAARDEGCSTTNPFRSGVAEVAAGS